MIAARPPVCERSFLAFSQDRLGVSQLRFVSVGGMNHDGMNPSTPDPSTPTILSTESSATADSASTGEALTTGERRSRRLRIAATFGLSAAVLAGGLGAAFAGAADGPASEPGAKTAPRAALMAESGGSADLDLGDTTLDELAAELAEHGLVLNVEPSGASADPADDPDAADRDTGTDEAGIDPFAGMTQDEIDALSDEEFFQLLEESGVEWDEVPADEWDDGDWDDSDWDDGDWDDSESDGADHDHDHDEYGGEEPLGAFPVDGDDIDLSSASSPEVAEQAKAIWDRFVQIIPADQRQMVVSFELVPEEFGGAYVYPSESDPTNWVLGMGLGLGDFQDYVLIHEFAHLLSLQASEVPPADSEADAARCPTYFTGEGCALESSLINEFVQAFWPPERYQTIKRLEAEGDFDGLQEYLEDLYEQNSDEFVTDYAATNPAEDWAETFAVFVTTDRPTGTTIADQKVLMLWNNAAMVELRAQILANMA